MQINNDKILRKAARESRRYRAIQTWRIFSSTPMHKRLRLSLFLTGIWTLYLVIPAERVSVLLSCYLWFRYVDDVADGEYSNPFCKTLKQFIEAKRFFLRKLESGHIEEFDLQGVDSLMVLTYLKCLEWGFNVIPSMLKILDAIAYDVERSEMDGAPAQREIDDYFTLLDYPTVLETLRIIGEKSIQTEDLKGFMDATRARYNLRDFLRDIEMGIVNISAEDLEKYGIDIYILKKARTLEDLHRHIPFKIWFTDQMNRMKKYLEEGKGILKTKSAMPVTRLMLYVGFTLPCQKFAKKWERCS